MLFSKSNKKTDLETIKTKLKDAFATIHVPEFKQNLTELDWVKEILFKGNKLAINVVLPTFALKSEPTVIEQIKTVAITALIEPLEVEVNVFSDVKPVFSESHFNEKIATVKNVILVASGKGGVGKSTVASNLAMSLHQMGCQVGLLDADVYGPSMPTMFGIDVKSGVEGFKLEGSETTFMKPKSAYGIPMMSLGFLVDTEQPMVWRGPMISSAAMQMFYQVAWGDLDYLIVDLPPGTGDIQLSISQKVVVSGAVIVSTPQKVALDDVTRSKAMFDKVNIPVLGLVENMSYFVCDGCDKRHEIFTHGGAKELANQLNMKFLSEIPLTTAIRAGGDEGKPASAALEHPLVRTAFEDLAQKIALLLTHNAQKGEATQQQSAQPPQKSAAKKGALPVLN